MVFQAVQISEQLNDLEECDTCGLGILKERRAVHNSTCDEKAGEGNTPHDSECLANQGRKHSFHHPTSRTDWDEHRLQRIALDMMRSFGEGHHNKNHTKRSPEDTTDLSRLKVTARDDQTNASTRRQSLHDFSNRFCCRADSSPQRNRKKFIGISKAAKVRKIPQKSKPRSCWKIIRAKSRWICSRRLLLCLWQGPSPKHHTSPSKELHGSSPETGDTYCGRLGKS